ncbi:olfactory receptor 2A12-like [Larimichthys crocea]|uniref:olfactory receptor 2A12-like n=1 Tax=Larimichthys crocea TaxID=215358 RepID=UPI000F5DABD8|nr:olfactory receptor 2A12-like [Larimichthys crocea]
MWLWLKHCHEWFFFKNSCNTYDRFIAICFPLKCHSIVTTPAIVAMLLSVWFFVFCLIALSVVFIDRLFFCRTLVINSFYGDHAPVFNLACNDTSLNTMIAYAGFIMILCLLLALTAFTYICISNALSRTASGKERVKALKTRSSHLILVAILFLPIVGTNISAVISSIHSNARMINSSLTHTIPALLNPIIYSLKTEVLKSIKKHCKINRISNTTLSKKVNSLSLL